MNGLISHLREVCRRNRLAPNPATILAFLDEMDDESIIEVLNNKDVLDITIKYGLIDINHGTIPPGLTIRVKDYDVQPEGDTLTDEGGPYFIQEFERDKV